MPAISIDQKTMIFVTYRLVRYVPLALPRDPHELVFTSFKGIRRVHRRGHTSINATQYLIRIIWPTTNQLFKKSVLPRPAPSFDLPPVRVEYKTAVHRLSKAAPAKHFEQVRSTDLKATPA